MPNENALAGVDYGKIKPFKDRMVAIAQETRHLPEGRGVFIEPGFNAHAVAYEYRGSLPHRWVATKEGLGNKAWIAMLLNQQGLADPTGRFHFGGIGVDTFLMGANDNAAHGGWPVILTDEVSVGLDEFFGYPQAAALADSFRFACIQHDCAMGQGESPAYKYLMKAEPPVKVAPSLGVCVIGLVASKERYVSGRNVRVGDVLIGVPSSGLHANGISPLIRWVMELPGGFLTKLNGRTVGEEALIPTRSYVPFVEAVLDDRIEVHAFLPMTGDGIGKFASDPRFHYNVHTWLPESQMPPLFRFMEEIGMPREGIAKTFNCGIGYVAIVPPHEVDRVLAAGFRTSICGEGGRYQPMVIGVVEEGPAGTYFAPWDLHLAPPGKD